MARTIDIDAYTAKQNDILDVAQGLIYSKGYEKMTIQDIRSALGISSGAFFHYFSSKLDVLESVVERIQSVAEQPLLAIADDPTLSALEKLRRFFTTLDQLRVKHQAIVIDLLRVWYTDENALVRQKVESAMVARRTPLLTAIVQQGIAEGTINTPYAEEAGGILLALIQGMSTQHAKSMLEWHKDQDAERCIRAIVATYAAYANAMARVLGVEVPLLEPLTPEIVQAWLHSQSQPQPKEV